MKMDKTYFAEKIEASCTSLETSAEYLQEVINLIRVTHYDLPNIVNAKQVHETLKTIAAQLNAAAIYFETARWASTSTKLEFEDWLNEQGLNLITAKTHS
jgi:hypothetical protein